MITIETVKHMAKLSKLGLTEDEVVMFQQKFNDVMTVVDKIKSINTDNIEPMHNPLDATAPLREDVVTENNQRDALLSGAPDVQNGLIKVNKVIS